MIRYITGNVFRTYPGELVLMVGAIGYRVFVLPDSVSSRRRDTPCSLWVHHAIREDVSDLYGFETEDELVFFELLLAVPGIGPKSALAILSLAPLDKLQSAIARGDAGYLTSVSGIGKKTAQKLVLELKEKVGSTDLGTTHAMTDDVDVIEALRALGYTTDEIRKVVARLPDDIEGTSARVREALQLLSQ